MKLSVACLPRRITLIINKRGLTRYLFEESKATTSAKDPKSDPEGSLAPPPRPSITTAEGETPDYFNSVSNPFALEPNPFEQSFSGGGGGAAAGGAASASAGAAATDTPGRSLLPPVAALASPAIPGGTSSNSGYNWSNSLRSGPLSPAMLAGPAGSSDYFDSIGRGFPTPNESSLRTGLTPGGGGSMFPAQSPNSQNILQQLQNGGATPSTIDFHRTALNAAKRSSINAPTSNPPGNESSEQADQSVTATMEEKTVQNANVDPFTHHDAADAANGLFMLAKGGQPNPGQFGANQSSIPPQNVESNEGDGNGANGAANGGRDLSGDLSDTQVEQQVKPAPKGKTKKNAGNKGANRRKAEDAPMRGANKKAKTNNGYMEPEPLSEPGESEDESPKRGHSDSK